jgi:hypothetical protein
VHAPYGFANLTIRSPKGSARKRPLEQIAQAVCRISHKPAAVSFFLSFDLLLSTKEKVARWFRTYCKFN